LTAARRRPSGGPSEKDRWTSLEFGSARMTRALDHLERGMHDLATGIGELRLALEEPRSKNRRGVTGPAEPAEIDALSPRQLSRLIEQRRERFRPASVKVLFVASPPDPTDSTNFYLANSHLFRCMRGAFASAFGRDVPNGEDFLEYFRDRGCFIVALPQRLRRGRGRPSGKTRRVETEYIANVLRDTEAPHVFAFRESLGQTTYAAVSAVALPATSVQVLRAPTDMLRDEFVRTLRSILDDEPSGRADPPGAGRSQEGEGAKRT
jgi:hypothetical protein